LQAKYSDFGLSFLSLDFSHNPLSFNSSPTHHTQPPLKMPDLHTLPTGSWPSRAIRNNGPDSLLLERYKLRELAEGWPCYRDACEWENLLSIFHPSAYIFTTWTGRTHHLDFIAASKAGMDKGAFIMHRIHGSTTDISPDGLRAVTKMKATITQRFELPKEGGGEL